MRQESGKAPSFLDATAVITGRGKSTISEDVLIGQRLAKETRDLLRGTAVADERTAQRRDARAIKFCLEELENALRARRA